MTLKKSAIIGIKILCISKIVCLIIKKLLSCILGNIRFIVLSQDDSPSMGSQPDICDKESPPPRRVISDEHLDHRLHYKRRFSCESNTPGSLKRGKPNTIKTGLPSPTRRRSIDRVTHDAAKHRFLSPDRYSTSTVAEPVASTLDTSPILKTEEACPVVLVIEEALYEDEESGGHLTRQTSKSSVVSIDQTHDQSHNQAFIQESMVLGLDQSAGNLSEQDGIDTDQGSHTRARDKSVFDIDFEAQLNGSVEGSSDDEVVAGSTLEAEQDQTPDRGTMTRDNIQTKSMESLDSAISDCPRHQSSTPSDISKCHSAHSIHSYDSAFSSDSNNQNRIPNDNPSESQNSFVISPPNSVEVSDCKDQTHTPCDTSSKNISSGALSPTFNFGRGDEEFKTTFVFPPVSPTTSYCNPVDRAISRIVTLSTAQGSNSEQSSTTEQGECTDDEILHKKESYFNTGKENVSTDSKVALCQEILASYLGGKGSSTTRSESDNKDTESIEQIRKEIAERKASPLRFPMSVSRKRAGVSPVRIPSIFAKADKEYRNRTAICSSPSSNRYQHRIETALKMSPGIKKPFLPLSTKLVKAESVEEVKSRLDSNAGHTPSRLIRDSSLHSCEIADSNSNSSNGGMEVQTPSTPKIKSNLLPARTGLSVKESLSSTRSPLKPIKRLQGMTPIRGSAFSGISSPMKVRNLQQVETESNLNNTDFNSIFTKE